MESTVSFKKFVSVTYISYCFSFSNACRQKLSAKNKRILVIVKPNVFIKKSVPHKSAGKDIDYFTFSKSGLFTSQQFINLQKHP